MTRPPVLDQIDATMRSDLAGIYHRERKDGHTDGAARIDIITMLQFLLPNAAYAELSDVAAFIIAGRD